MKKTWALALAIAAVLVLAMGVAALVHRAAPAPPPQMEGLTEILKRAAEKKINSAGLASEQLTFVVPADQIEKRAKAVIDAAIQAGGTAIKTTQPDGSATVLAQIPRLNAALFHGLIKSGPATEPPDAEASSTRIIEVVIKTP